MFYREINSELKLAVNLPHFAEVLYNLVNQNRDYLREWLPWLDDTTEQKDIEKFTKSVVSQMAEGRGFTCLIVYQDNIVGVVSLV